MGESILTDADAPTLGERTTGNLTALFRAMSSLKSGEYRPDGAVGRHHAFPTNPMFKGAWGTRIEGDVDTVIDETIDWFKGRGAPYFFWWTDVATRPPDLGQRLEARGLLSMEDSSA